MILVCDEGVDRPIVECLRREGFESRYVAEMSPGIADEEVLRLAKSENALLVTTDKDFGELVYRQRRASAGVVLLRLAGLTENEKCQNVLAAFHTHGEAFQDAFTVISKGLVRIRPLRT